MESWRKEALAALTVSQPRLSNGHDIVAESLKMAELSIRKRSRAWEILCLVEAIANLKKHFLIQVVVVWTECPGENAGQETQSDEMKRQNSAIFILFIKTFFMDIEMRGTNWGNFRGTKYSWFEQYHFVDNIFVLLFCTAGKVVSFVGKIFVVRPSTTKTMNILPPRKLPSIYGICSASFLMWPFPAEIEQLEHESKCVNYC